MSQQINLLNPLLRKQRFSFTSPVAMLYGIGIALVLAMAAALYENNRLEKIEAQAGAVAKSLKEAQARHEALTAKSAVRKPDPNLEAKVLDLSAQVKIRQQVIDALKGDAIGTTTGFSEYMRAFSRQRVEGVWLTAFDIAGGGSDLTIAGRALSADLVPAYLLRLNKEAPMQGRQFASVTIHQAKTGEAAAKARVGATDAASAPSLPPYLDFTVSSGDLGAATRAGPSAAQSTAPVTPDSSGPGKPKVLQ